MSRPKGRTGKPTNLYLDADVKREAMKLAVKQNKSLSDIVGEEFFIGEGNVLTRRDPKQVPFPAEAGFSGPAAAQSR